MKKRSMLAVASLAAGIVTALVTPPPSASADTTGLDHLPDGTSVGSLMEETVDGVAGGDVHTKEAGSWA